MSIEINNIIKYTGMVTKLEGEKYEWRYIKGIPGQRKDEWIVWKDSMEVNNEMTADRDE